MSSLFDQYMNSREENTKKVNKMMDTASSSGGGDNRFWKATFNKETGSGFAIIRFLPGTDPAELPYVKKYHHYFKGKNGIVYWENSLTTINQKDPVGELNGRLWNSGEEKMKNVARDQKRKVQYTCNIQVIKDPANPDAEGKVFLFKANQTIFNKIEEARKSEDEYGEPKIPIQPFDIIEGAPFKIKIKDKAGWQNYDDCEFADVNPIADTTDEMKSIFESQHDLSEFLSDDEFKSYDELLGHLNNVLESEPWADKYLSYPANSVKSQAADNSPGEMMSADDFSSSTDDAAENNTTSQETLSDDDDDDMAAFLSSLDE